jgi:hypothetical protein
MSTQPSTQRPTDPFSPGLQRLAALSGIGFAILLVVAIALSSAETPDFNDPLREWTSYADDNADRFRVAAVVMALAAFEFLWFLGLVRSALGEAETRARGFTRLAFIVLAGGIVGIAGLTLGVVTAATALAHGAETSPEIIRSLNMVAGAPFSLSSVGFATMLYTASFVIMRAGGLPRWLGWVSLAGGLFFLLQLGTWLSEDGDNAFGFFYPLGFLALIVFAVAASLDLTRRVGRPD